jgi:hypothetical protein
MKLSLLRQRCARCRDTLCRFIGKRRFRADDWHEGGRETNMRNRQGEESETYHLTCPVCSALPGTSCIDEGYQELAKVHPSRRISIAERNRRHAASGWEPPELAERHRREHDAKVARAPLFNPRLGPGVTAALEGRRPRNPIEPHRGPWSMQDAIQEPASSPRDAGAAEAGMSPGGLPADGDTCSWFAAYLGGFPEDAAVPRQKLRDIAHEKWPEDGPMPPSRARQRRHRMEGRSGRSSTGRRSSHKLTEHLRSFEELGLIRRDNARDMVIITDPDGLRRLADVLPQPVPGRAGGRDAPVRARAAPAPCLPMVGLGDTSISTGTDAPAGPSPM